MVAMPSITPIAPAHCIFVQCEGPRLWNILQLALDLFESRRSCRPLLQDLRRSSVSVESGPSGCPGTCRRRLAKPAAGIDKDAARRAGSSQIWEGD